MLNEADTCTRFVVPKLLEAGWDAGVSSFNEQQFVQVTNGKIFLAGSRPRRKPPKRADYLLKYTRYFTIAVVEAKAEDRPAGEGMQQAKFYAEMLGLRFAYSTKGHQVIEFDFFTGAEREL